MREMIPNLEHFVQLSSLWVIGAVTAPGQAIPGPPPKPGSGRWQRAPGLQARLKPGMSAMRNGSQGRDQRGCRPFSW